MPALKSEQTTDFSFGMVDSAAATNYPRDAAALLVNARIEPDGTVSRRNGSARTHATSLGAATGFGGAVFTTAAGAEQLVVFIGTSAYMSANAGVTWTLIGSALRQDYYDFTTMRVGATNYLFAANGDTTIKRWNGVTFDALPGAPSGVKYVEVFNGRLWAAGHSGVIVQGSRVADPTTWLSPDGVAVQIMSHSASEITGLYQLGPHLLVFDRDATSYIDGYGEATLVVATGATGFSRSVGCLAHRSIAGVGDNAVCWLSHRGVEYYAPGSGITLVSSSVERFLESIAREHIKANPGTPTAIYDDRRQNYHIAFATTGVRNNRVLVLNLRQNVQYQRQGVRAAASFDRYLDPDGTLLFGIDGDGHLYVDPGGFELKSQPDGYMTLDLAMTGGDPTDVDADGYLTTVLNNAVPATMFGSGENILSVGYDGYVRRQDTGDTDDALADGTPGTDITMTLVSKPFIMRAPRRRKRVRLVHVSTIQERDIDVSVSVRAGGVATASQTACIEATAFNQPKRRRFVFSAVDDAPQVEVRTKDPVRVVLVGVSAELIREPVA